MRRSVEQLTEVWEVSERNLGREQALKNIARVCSERSFRTLHFMCARLLKKNRLQRNCGVFAFSGNGRGPGEVREGPGRRSGEGPGGVRKVF